MELEKLQVFESGLSSKQVKLKKVQLKVLKSKQTRLASVVDNANLTGLGLFLFVGFFLFFFFA